MNIEKIDDRNSQDESQYTSCIDSSNLVKISNSRDEFSIIFKSSPRSPATPMKNTSLLLLNKKRCRKNSDLKMNYQTTDMKSDNFSSPYTTETKITNYFLQKKSSSFSKSIFRPSEQKSMTGSSIERSEMSKKFPFVKKLVFDTEVVENKNNVNNFLSFHDITNYNNTNKFIPSKNWNISKILEEDEIEKEPEQEEFTKLWAVGESNDLLNKNFQENIFKSHLISDKTYEILKQIKNENKQQQNFNLNKIIKDMNSPVKKSYHKKKDTILKNADKIINSFSMKEKYEELLNRELMLPCHYKNLYKKMIQLDEVISNSKNEIHFILTLSKINNHLMDKNNMSINVEEFQQILLITPHFYIYKWEIYKNKIELIIDIPFDIKKRINETNVYDQKTNFTQLQTLNTIPIKQPLDTELLNKRNSIFKKILLHLTNEHHKNFLKQNGIKTKLNPFKHRTWHSEFDVHKVPDIELFSLISKPKILIRNYN